MKLNWFKISYGFLIFLMRLDCSVRCASSGAWSFMENRRLANQLFRWVNTPRSKRFSFSIRRGNALCQRKVGHLHQTLVAHLKMTDLAL